MSDFPAREPRMDPIAVAADGGPLEDVGAVASRQPYRSTGPVVRYPGLELLANAAVTGKVGRFNFRGNTDAAALVSAGLLDSSGRLTDSGQLLSSVFREPSVAVTVAGSYLRHTTNLQIWIGSHGALVAAGPSVHSLLSGGPGDGARNVQLDWVDADGIPTIVASWAGVVPAWPVALVPDRIGQTQFNKRLVDGPRPDAPNEASEAFSRFWAEPWFRWSMEIERTGYHSLWLSAGAAGHFRYGTVNTDVRFQAVPTAMVWSEIVAAVHRGVNG